MGWTGDGTKQKKHFTREAFVIVDLCKCLDEYFVVTDSALELTASPLTNAILAESGVDTWYCSVKNLFPTR